MLLSVLFLLIHCFMYPAIVCGVLRLVFVMLWITLCLIQSILVLQSYWRRRESRLLCINFLPGVLWLLVLCGSSSRWRGLVYSVRVLLVFPHVSYSLTFWSTWNCIPNHPTWATQQRHRHTAYMFARTFAKGLFKKELQIATLSKLTRNSAVRT